MTIPPPPPPPASAGPSTPLRAPPTSTTLVTPAAFVTQPAAGAPLPRALSTSAPVAALASPLAGIFINQQVPLVLTLNPPNYTQWRTLFEVTFAKYGVTDHIDAPPPAAPEYWLQDDAHIVSWLYNRVSPEIFGLVHQRNATASSIWASIATLFLENAEHQVVFLATEFRRIDQGAGSVIQYFARLKDCADRLADLGEPVSDRDQVLNMFRGLAPRLQYAIPILTMQRPLPSFLSCRAFLLLEESRHTAHNDGFETALHAARHNAPPGFGGANSSGGGSGGQPSGGGHSQNSGGGNGYRNGRGGGSKGKGKAPTSGSYGGANHTSGSSSAPRPPTPSSAPWTGMVHAWAMPWRPHAPGSGILGPRPGAPPFAGAATHHGAPSAPPYYGAPYNYGTTVPYGAPATPAQQPNGPAWDQSALIQALNAMAPPSSAPQAGGGWYLDTGATSHMTSSSGMLSSARPVFSSRIVVGDGSSLPVSHTGHAHLPTTTNPLALNSVLVCPNLIKNLISVKALTRDNPINVEFDHLGFSVKDRQTRTEILRCDDDGDLYLVTAPVVHHNLTVATVDLWHQRLGHPGRDALQTTLRQASPQTSTGPAHTCTACQLGKHTRFPFSDSAHVSYFPFQLVHCDLWTSPVISNSGCKYYLVILDDYSHFVWTFPLRHKSDTLPTLRTFQTFIQRHFNLQILTLQTDNGREFDNLSTRAFFASQGIVLRMSCPYTSPQNGRAERILRTINDTVRSMLTHASMPLTFWVEALNTATFLVNRRPCKPRSHHTPFFLLYGIDPDYSQLRVFGCLCFPNTAATAIHKLAPRSTPCVFLGYSPDHKGYRCLNRDTGRVLISRHVFFDENQFPYRSTPAPIPPPPDDDLFHTPPTSSSPLHHQPMAGTPPVPEPPLPDLPSSPAPSHTSPGSTRLPAPPQAPPPPSPPPVATPPATKHHMITRSKNGIFQPNPKYAHLTTTSSISPIPKTVRTALHDPVWLTAMQEEFGALTKNRTWTLVPRPPGANIVTGKWLFRHKLKSDGTLERYKARWVVRGFSQRPGIDFDQTFSPVVKSATIRAVLAIAASRDWPVRQMDVNNAFLQGFLNERVYCQQPAGFVDAAHPDHVCLLDRSLYGLKQAPRAWFERFGAFIRTLGFTAARSDPSLFILRRADSTAFLLLYVDDIVLTASSTALLQQLQQRLLSEFSMKDLGPLHYFLGIRVTRSSSGFFLSQHKYAEELLDRANMSQCRSAPTPVDTRAKLAAADGAPLADPSEYRSLVGALQYLTMTRPDLAYAVHQACLYMHDPREAHLALVKRILRYLRGSAEHGLHLHRSTALDLVAYSDADWAGCPDTRRSTSGYAVFLGDALISWSSKRQPTVSRSSAEAEYRAVANVVAECCWLRHLLGELHVDLPKATVVYCDNISSVYMAANPVHHRRTKHIELDIHFVREKVALGALRVLHVPTTQQFADLMTKGLPTAAFEEFRSSLCIRPPDAQTAAGCQRKPDG
uniref:Uncharacterized protein n=1 Tax=Avena sativa TaxID=4498 RepID=A0ACD5V1F3_AVESA